ncbi:hypothetical protein HCN44_005230 [Aphidius gifuensis]|uniref:Tektin n=1 Tax=Aphidius gifuensis TaxID=684658 RepID=A0A834XVG8_APHGI|nr:hypothetical protein HCN44_005230 [Aphidius gifuensis]
MEKINEKMSSNIEQCPETKPNVLCNELSKNTISSKINPNVTFDEKAVCESNITNDTWTPLARLTGTRPTVDKLTVSRYSPGEWKLHNKEILNNSNIFNLSKNIAFATNSIEKKICSQVDRDQQDTYNDLRKRASTIFCWKIELEKNNNNITMEIDEMKDETKRLLRSNQAIKNIININKNMQKTRNLRMKPDLVTDSLTEELIKEEFLCDEVMNLYTRCIDEIKMQMTELKDAKQRLEHDWSDKTTAHEIDSSCIGLRSETITNQWNLGCVKFPQNQSSTNDYEKFIKETLAFCQIAVGRSRVLRANLKEIVDRSVKDLRNQADKCLKKLSDNEKMIKQVSSTVQRLDAPMKCAQSRLSMRLTRENVENCRDEPHYGLIDEVKGISEGTTILSGHINSLNESLDYLTTCRQKIENEIMIKRKSLWIDSDRCQYIRSSYPSWKILSGYE